MNNWELRMLKQVFILNEREKKFRRNLLYLHISACLYVRLFIAKRSKVWFASFFLFLLFRRTAKPSLKRSSLMHNKNGECGSEYLDKCIMSSILNGVLNNSRWHLRIQTPGRFGHQFWNRKETDQHLRNESENTRQGTKAEINLLISFTLSICSVINSLQYFPWFLLKGPFQSCCPQNSVNFSGETKKKQTKAKEKEAFVLF